MKKILCLIFAVIIISLTASASADTVFVPGERILCSKITTKNLLYASYSDTYSANAYYSGNPVVYDPSTITEAEMSFDFNIKNIRRI